MKITELDLMWFEAYLRRGSEAMFRFYSLMESPKETRPPVTLDTLADISNEAAGCMLLDESRIAGHKNGVPESQKLV